MPYVREKEMSTDILILPLDIITSIFDYLNLAILAKIQPTSRYINEYYKKRLYQKYSYFHTLLFNKPSAPSIAPSIALSVSQLPQHFSPNIHIIYSLLHKFNKCNTTPYQDTCPYFYLITSTTLYHHILPRYTTFSGFVPFINIPTALGFYKLISVYPYTEDPEMFVMETMGGITSRDREYNTNIYYTRAFESYKHPLTFQQLVPKLLSFIS